MAEEGGPFAKTRQTAARSPITITTQSIMAPQQSARRLPRRTILPSRQPLWNEGAASVRTDSQKISGYPRQHGNHQKRLGHSGVIGFAGQDAPAGRLVGLMRGAASLSRWRFTAVGVFHHEGYGTLPIEERLGPRTEK